jgi:hypothetical protein
MADQLKNIVHFVAIPAGNTVSLPHKLHVGGRAVIPDYLDPDPKGLTVTADAVNVTVTNTTAAPLDVFVLCESWHSIERAFGAVGVQSLIQQPFVSTGGASGGGGGSSATLTVTGEVVTADLAGATFPNFNPPGFDGLASTILVTNSDPNSIISGLKAQPVGRIVWIIAPQTNSDRFLIADNAGGSLAANRFQLPNLEGWYLEPGSAAAFRYDGTLSRWLPIGFWSAGMASLHVLGASQMDAGLAIIQGGLTVTGPNGFVHAVLEVDAVGFYNRGKLVEKAIINPVAIAGAINDYNPVDAVDPTLDLSTTRFVRQALSGAASLTGLIAPNGFNDGQHITIRNISPTFTLTLNHENVASLAGNRFQLASAASLVIPLLGSVDLWHDPVSGRWTVV